MTTVCFEVCAEGDKPPSVTGVYFIIHNESGCYYFGSSRDIHRRYGEHLSDLRNNNHGNHDLQKRYNSDQNLTFGYREVDTFMESVSLETELIKGHRSNELMLNKVTNSIVMTEEHRVNIAISLTGKRMDDKTRMAVGNAARGNKYWVGRKHRQETKDKLREIHKGNSYATGHKKTPEGIAKIIATHLGRKHSARSKRTHASK